MPSLELPPEHLALLTRILVVQVPEIEVLAYGSRVTGESHAGSDLDLALRAPSGEPLPAERLAALREALEESPLPILVDVLDWAWLPESFRREIERACIQLQAPGAA